MVIINLTNSIGITAITGMNEFYLERMNNSLVSEEKGIHSGCEQKSGQEVDCPGGEDRHDGADRDGLPGVSQVTRPVGPGHNT